MYSSRISKSLPPLKAKLDSGDDRDDRDDRDERDDGDDDGIDGTLANNGHSPTMSIDKSKGKNVKSWLVSMWTVSIVF